MCSPGPARRLASLPQMRLREVRWLVGLTAATMVAGSAACGLAWVLLGGE